MQFQRITTVLVVLVVAIQAFPADQSPAKTGKIQHISEYYANDHPAAYPKTPSRPTPINPDIVSEPKPEEKIHIIKDADKDDAVAPGSHRSRRSLDDTEHPDEPTTPKLARAWWRRGNFGRTTEEPEEEKAPEVSDEKNKSSEEKKENSSEDKKDEKECESDEDEHKKTIIKESIAVQHIQTQPLPVIQPHDELI